MKIIRAISASLLSVLFLTLLASNGYAIVMEKSDDIDGGHMHTKVIAQAYVIDDTTTKQYDLFTAQFVDLGNGTLYDTKTKLIWDKHGNAEGKDINWYQAESYIKGLNQQGYKGFSDWRMPTLEEMQTLVGYAKSGGYGSGSKTIAAFLNKKGFEPFGTNWFWTSSMKSPSDAWFVSLECGRETTLLLDNAHNKRVLVVRSER